MNEKAPMGSDGYWAGVGQRLNGAYDSLKNFGSIPSQADEIAEQAFPGSARDASTKNAFRHANLSISKDYKILLNQQSKTSVYTIANPKKRP